MLNVEVSSIGVSRPDYDAEFDADRLTTNWKAGYPLLAAVLREHGCKVGTEVGVCFGWHADAILTLAPCVDHLYGVDPYQYRPDYADILNISQERFNAMYLHMTKNMRKHQGRFTAIRDYSTGAAKVFKDGELDFVYIDAEHTYEECSKDLAMWGAKVRPGGIISGHDWEHPNFPGVTRAVKEYAERRGLQLHTDGGEFFWWAVKGGGVNSAETALRIEMAGGNP